MAVRSFMLRYSRLALGVASLGCASILGIDGDYQDEPSGSGATGGSGGASGGDAAVGGSGGSGLTGAEDCLNGIDDDDDSQVDCADPDCQVAFDCEAAAPAGFTGPAVMWSGTGTQKPPPCGAPNLGRLELFAGLSAAPANCGAVGCQCTTVGAASCVALVKYVSGGCTVNGTYTPIGAGCTDISVGGPAFANFVIGVSGNLSCLPMASSKPAVPPLSWSARHALCLPSSPGAGCGAGVCAPKVDASYSKRCVFQKGIVGCPAAYPQTFSLHAGADDSRDCTACTCDNSGSCAVSVDDFDSSGCAGTQSTIPKGGSCLEVDGPTAQRSVKVTTTTPSCVAGGGAPVGSAAPADPVTVCCQ